MAHRLAPPNRAALWASLALTKAQLAALCGLSQRQVTWWAAQGYLPRSGRDPARYSGDAVDMAVLIRQGLDQGLPQRQAVRQARVYLAAETTRQPGLLALDEAELRAIATRLTQADTAARQVLEVVAPLASLAAAGSRRSWAACGRTAGQGGGCRARWPAQRYGLTA